MKNVYKKIQDAKDSGVTSVHLGFNDIAAHAPATAAAFKDSGVTSVNLKWNRIAAHAPTTAAAFKDSGVTSVNLVYNDIAAHAPATATAFKDSGVTSVNLRGNNIALEDSLQVLKTFQDEDNTITRLAIDHSQNPAFVQLLNAPREHMELANANEHLGLPQDVLGLIGDYITLDIFE